MGGQTTVRTFSIDPGPKHCISAHGVQKGQLTHARVSDVSVPVVQVQQTLAMPNVLNRCVKCLSSLCSAQNSCVDSCQVSKLRPSESVWLDIIRKIPQA